MYECTKTFEIKPPAYRGVGACLFIREHYGMQLKAEEKGQH